MISERLWRMQLRKRAAALVVVDMVGVVSLVSLVWLGLSADARGLRNPAGPHSAARAERIEEPITCPGSSPAEDQSPKVTVLDVWSRALMVHSSRWNGRMRYGPSSPWERPHDGGGPSS